MRIPSDTSALERMPSIKQAGIPLVAGCDVGKFSLDLCVSGVLKRYNSPHQIPDLISDCLRQNVSFICIESTGAYERPLIASCHAVGLKISRVSGARVRSFAKAEGQRGKSDELDASLLARFGTTMVPKLTLEKNHIRTELRALCDRRYHFAFDASREKCRKDTAVLSLHDSIKSHIEYLNKEIKTLDKAILKIVKEHFLEFSDALREVKGIGPVCVATLIAYMPELGFATRSEITALVGLAPYIRDSGIYSGKRKISGGRAPVRKALYMCAMTAARCDKKMSVFYDKLRKKGKSPRVCYVAIARRLLVRLNAIWGEHCQNYVQAS